MQSGSHNSTPDSLAAASEWQMQSSAQAIITDIRQRFPHYAGQCQTVYNGVDSELFTPPSGPRSSSRSTDRFVVLFVGRVSPEKGVHDLIAAMRIVLDNHPEAELHIVGEVGSIPRNFIVDVSDDELIQGLARFYGDYIEALREAISPEHSSRVVFHGHASSVEVVEHYQRADVLVNPSYSESFGLTLVEAMACEVPVVGTAVGGMKETIVDGITGYLVQAGRVDQLAERLNALADDRDLCELLGRCQGRQRVLERFSWDRVAADVKRVRAAAGFRTRRHRRAGRTMIRTGARRLMTRRLSRRAHPLVESTIMQSAIVFAPHPDDETLGCGGLIALELPTSTSRSCSSPMVPAHTAARSRANWHLAGGSTNRARGFCGMVQGA